MDYTQLNTGPFPGFENFLLKIYNWWKKVSSNICESMNAYHDWFYLSVPCILWSLARTVLVKTYAEHLQILLKLVQYIVLVEWLKIWIDDFIVNQGEKLSVRKVSVRNVISRKCLGKLPWMLN